MTRDVTHADHEAHRQAMLKDPKYIPAVFEINADDCIRRAARLADASAQMHYTIHTPKGLLPGNLTDEQFAQRQAILEIGAKIIQAEFRAEMDKVVDYWIEYRKRS